MFALVGAHSVMVMRTLTKQTHKIVSTPIHPICLSLLDGELYVFGPNYGPEEWEYGEDVVSTEDFSEIRMVVDLAFALDPCNKLAEIESFMNTIAHEQSSWGLSLWGTWHEDEDAVLNLIAGRASFDEWNQYYAPDGFSQTIDQLYTQLTQES